MKFSYSSYARIIAAIQKRGDALLVRSPDATAGKETFVISRHDVEFSPERAFRLATLESECGFSSNYFFQITNNSYNLLSKRNVSMVREMADMGHEIGLHFHLNGLTDTDAIRDRIAMELSVMEQMTGLPITTFSIHRPPRDVLAEEIVVPGKVNLYARQFFFFTDSAKALEDPPIKYLSDARHRWNYGTPDEETLGRCKKIQILTHPYSWTQEGLDNLENFRSLIEEKNAELLDTIDGECSHFKEVRDAL